MIHVLWGASESPENQLLPDPVWPQNHLPWGLKALRGEGEMRASQVLRDPFGTTSGLSLAVTAGSPTLRCPGVRRSGEALARKASSPSLFPATLSTKSDSFSNGIQVVLSSLMVFPAAVHSCPPPASAQLHLGAAPSSISVSLRWPFSGTDSHGGTVGLARPVCSPQNKMGFAHSTFGFMTHIDQLDSLFSHAQQEASSERNENRSHEQ